MPGSWGSWCLIINLIFDIIDLFSDLDHQSKIQVGHLFLLLLLQLLPVQNLNLHIVMNIALVYFLNVFFLYEFINSPLFLLIWNFFLAFSRYIYLIVNKNVKGLKQLRIFPRLAKLKKRKQLVFGSRIWSDKKKYL